MDEARNRLDEQDNSRGILVDNLEPAISRFTPASVLPRKGDCVHTQAKVDARADELGPPRQIQSIGFGLEMEDRIRCVAIVENLITCEDCSGESLEGGR
jgi:hypothetical protein